MRAVAFRWQRTIHSSSKSSRDRPPGATLANRRRRRPARRPRAGRTHPLNWSPHHSTLTRHCRPFRPLRLLGTPARPRQSPPREAPPSRRRRTTGAFPATRILPKLRSRFATIPRIQACATYSIGTPRTKSSRLSEKDPCRHRTTFPSQASPP